MSGTRMSTTGGQHSFAMVPRAEIQRSVFNRSHGHKTTFDAGWLIPVFVDEALPGDTMEMRMTAFGRFATLLRPIMDNVYLDVFFFAVPNRLLWTNWQKFNGEQLNPGDSTSYLVPQVTPPTTGWAELSMADYFGLPTKVTSGGAGYPVPNALPFRAYGMIYNEWFRDENLVTRMTVGSGDGPDPNANYPLKRRGKRHDYFTSALPWPQKGTAVSLPLGVSANVLPQATEHTTGTLSGREMRVRSTNTGAAPTAMSTLSIGASAGQFAAATSTVTTIQSLLYPTNLVADLTTATAATINQLREAFQVQRLFERDARGGTRYTEILRSHFGVVSPDARLQRPEYLGGGTIRININPIASTSESTTPALSLGDLGATGTFSTQGVGFRQSFTEHCTLLGLVCVRADLNYQQGAERMWFRRTRFDYYWPALAHLGEQSILNQEIFVQGTAADTQVFGYQERYAEYRYKPSIVSARMRSNAATPLDSWHLAQNFGSLPVLNSTFIEENPPVSRVIAVTSEPAIVGDFFFDYKCARPMPIYGVPGLIDHF